MLGYIRLINQKGKYMSSENNQTEAFRIGQLEMEYEHALRLLDEAYIIVDYLMNNRDTLNRLDYPALHSVYKLYDAQNKAKILEQLRS